MRRGSRLCRPPPGFTWKVSFCTLYLWKAAWLPTTERRLRNYPRWWKKQPLLYRGPLVPARLFPIRRIFHTWVSERTGAVLWQPKPRPDKLSTKCTKCVCMKADHFRSCVWPGVWHSRGFQMGVYNAPPPCLYKAIVCELPTLYLSRKTSFIGSEVPQVA